jgi:hypothetical protein
MNTDSLIHTIHNNIAIGFAFVSARYDTDVKILQKLIRSQQESPPVEVHQIEAFGGTLYDMGSKIHILRNELTIEDIRFLIDFCMEHINIDYFVVCIIQFIKTIIKKTDDSIYRESILPDVYTFFLFLTHYYNTHKNVELYWAYDIVYAWHDLLCVSTDMWIQFSNDSNSIYEFLEILKCQTRGSLFPCENKCEFPKSVPRPQRVSYCLATHNRFTDLPSENDICIRSELIKIHGTILHQICFEMIYSLMDEKRLEDFMEIAVEYWPFIRGDNDKFLIMDEILQILEQIKREERYPKSANKRK